MSLNIVNLVGRAGAEPEIRYFDSGNVLCELSIAVKRPTSTIDKPDLFKLKIWRKNPEKAVNKVHKGSLIGIKGSLVIETWEDRNTGKQRSSPVIRVDRLDLLGSKRDIDPNAVSGYGSESEF